MNLDEIEDSVYQHICVYGPPKSGKTVLVGQLAKHFRLFYFSLDDGVKALRHNLDPQYFHNVNVVRLPDTKAFPVACETLLKVFTRQRCQICWDHGVVGCIHCKKNPQAKWTEVYLPDFTQQDILVIDHAEQLSKSAIATVSRGKGDDYKLDWDDWAKVGSLLDRIFVEIQQGAFHCCVITHEISVKMEDGREKLVPQCGTTNYSRTFGKFFDHIVYSELFNKKHKFSSSTIATMGAMTGSRANVALERTVKEGAAPPELFEMFMHPADFPSTLQAERQEAADRMATIQTQIANAATVNKTVASTPAGANPAVQAVLAKLGKTG